MKRRGQIVVLRELFTFVMGIIIMLSVLYIFNSVILPEISEYSVNEQAYAVLFHVNSLLTRVETMTRSVNGALVSLHQDMPETINNNNYRVYNNSNQLCIRTSGDRVLSHCVNMSVDASVSGNYLSGTELMINSSFDNGQVLIDFDNVVEYVTVCTDAGCDDSNPCTSDSCIGISCFYSVLSGQQSGCSDTTGCTGAGETLCSCVASECVDVCGDAVCSDVETHDNCATDCP